MWRGRFIAPIRRNGQAHHPGTYVVTGLPLAVAGLWRVRIDVLVSDFEKLILAGEIELR